MEFNIKKIVRIALALVLALALTIWITVFCLDRVPVGYAGLQYSTSGVKEEVLSTGWHITSPLVHVKGYPISQQRIVFSDNPSDYDEKVHDDWHIDAPTSDGANVKLNLSVNYQFDVNRLVEIYNRFAGCDGETLVERYVQNDIVAYTKEVTRQFSPLELYSTKLPDVNDALTKHLDSKLYEIYGIHVTGANIIRVILPDDLQQKLNARENAKADAETAALEKETALAQAETKKAQAEAEAAVDKIKAEGKAEVRKIETDSEAYNNKTIAESITPEYIDYITAKARQKHGWVTIQGANTIVTTEK